jgi:hypothetical protein
LFPSFREKIAFLIKPSLDFAMQHKHAPQNQGLVLFGMGFDFVLTSLAAI